MSGRKSIKSYRLGIPVPPKGRTPAPAPSTCRVTQGYFPPPDEALDLSWTGAQMMEGCRRVPQEELTDELRTRLLTAGLTLAQIAELFCFCRAKRNRIRQEMANSPDDDPEAVLEPLDDDDTMEDDEMAAAIKLASLEEAKQYGIKLPEEEKKTMKFHEGVLSGQMDPRQAIIKCEPSDRGDITKEVLDKCAAVGMTAKEIAPGFRVKESLIYNECWRKNVKLLKKNRFSAKPVAPENTTSGNVSGGGTGVQPKDDKQPAPAGVPVPPEPVTPIVAGDLLMAGAHTPTPAELAAMLETGERPTISDDEAVQQIIQSFHNSDGPISRPGIRPRRVYVAHPLRGGKLQDNINKATAICSKYAQRSDIIPMSPIHAFCFVDPMTLNQTRGMEMCFALLGSCDELWVHGEWWTSEGCLAEICWASLRGIPVRFMTVHPVVEGRQLA